MVYLGSIPIGTPAGYFVIQVIAVDDGVATNTLIQYSVVNASVPFSILENGSIITASLIKELWTYTLLVLQAAVLILKLMELVFYFLIPSPFVNTAPGEQGTSSASLLTSPLVKAIQ